MTLHILRHTTLSDWLSGLIVFALSVAAIEMVMR